MGVTIIAMLSLLAASPSPAQKFDLSTAGQTASGIVEKFKNKSKHFVVNKTKDSSREMIPELIKIEQPHGAGVHEFFFKPDGMLTYDENVSFRRQTREGLLPAHNATTHIQQGSKPNLSFSVRNCRYNEGEKNDQSGCDSSAYMFQNDGRNFGVETKDWKIMVTQAGPEERSKKDITKVIAHNTRTSYSYVVGGTTPDLRLTESESGNPKDGQVTIVDVEKNTTIESCRKQDFANDLGETLDWNVCRQLVLDFSQGRIIDVRSINNSKTVWYAAHLNSLKRR